jgi:hypothetical protein
MRLAQKLKKTDEILKYTLPNLKELKIEPDRNLKMPKFSYNHRSNDIRHSPH